MEEEKDIIPTGSEVPAEESGQTSQEEPTTEVGQTEPEGEQTDEGKDESKESESEALKKQIANLEKVLGRQGKELGDLKKNKSSEQETKEEAKDYDALEAEITDKLDAGEIDLKTALRQMNQLATERGAQMATMRFQEQQKQQTSAKMVNEFKQKNPDFEEVLESGELDKIIQDNPLHDDFSAYHEYKLRQTQAQLDDQLKAAREEGKSEGMKLASESSNASKVLGKRGDALRSQNKTKQPANRAETKRAMLEALKAAREQ
jgi:hypothetical protein